MFFSFVKENTYYDKFFIEKSKMHLYTEVQFHI